MVSVCIVSACIYETLFRLAAYPYRKMWTGDRFELLSYARLFVLFNGEMLRYGAGSAVSVCARDSGYVVRPEE